MSRPAFVFEPYRDSSGPGKLAEAIEAWRAQPTDADASDLHFARTAARQELSVSNRARRHQRSVAMRDLLGANEWPQRPAALDRDVVHFAVLGSTGIPRAAQDRLVKANILENRSFV